MSTIFGIFNRTENVVESNTFQVIDNALSYWESDNNGSWEKSSIVLGHKMLWNTPESKLEDLPYTIHTNNQTFAITIDSRLDNREELVKQLEMSSLPLEKITDSMIVLAAYQKWGEECPKYFLGDFVFVIWDAYKEQLFCVRDQIGIMPFYYYLCDDLFIFSNDIRGLIAYSEINKKYNDKSIAMYLSGSLGFYDEKDTFFEHIKKLPAARTLAITNNHVKESIYWDIQDISNVYYNTYEEYVVKLRELLHDAVKTRLRTVFPVASHLSGGIDSSAVAVLAARELKKCNRPLYAFNWIATPDGEHDPDYLEWGYATQIESLENIEKKNIKVTAKFISELYDKINIATDDATYLFEEYAVRDEAEKYKVRNLLSGWGGDELISYDGYAYISGLVRQGKVIKAIKKIYYFYMYKKIKYKYLRTIKRFIRELIYPILYKHMSGLYKKRKLDHDPLAFANDQFSILAREFSFRELIFYPGVHNEQKALFKNGHILQRVENWASSAFEKKLIYSYPLLDRRIVEFALAIPEDMYEWKEGHQRFLFRSAISSFLPKHIAWEAKSGEPVHGNAWVKIWNEALRLWMKKNENILENRNSYIDRSKIVKRLKAYFTNRENGIEDDISTSGIVASILLSNLKDKPIRE